MSRLMNVTLVVPTYHRPDLLDNLLLSLKEVDDNFEVVVVDDAIDSDTRAVVNKYEIGKYVRGEECGAMYARQKGVEHAKGEIIGFLEDDMTVNENFIQPIINSFEDGENIVQSKIVEENKKNVGSPISIYRWNFGHKVNFNANEQKYLKFCQESGLFVNANILETHPVLNNKLIGDYGSSLDFSFRVRSEGYDILFNPDSILYHHEAKFGGTVENNDKLREDTKQDRHCTRFYKEYYHNLTYIHSKHHTKYIIFAIIYHFARSILRSIKYRELQCIKICILGIISGIYASLKSK